MLTMIPVHSDNIRSIGYDDSTYILHIRYTDDSKYFYKNVKMETFMELIFCKSKNDFLEENIFNKYEKIAG